MKLQPENPILGNSQPKMSTFCLKISTPCILEELISNLDLDFLNSDVKIHFLADLGRKKLNCLRFLKFEPQNPFFGKPRPIKHSLFASYVLVSALSKFIFTSFCSILTVFGFLGIVFM